MKKHTPSGPADFDPADAGHVSSEASACDEAMDAALRAELDAALAGPIPDRIDDLIQASAARACVWRRRISASAAAAAAIALFASGWASQTWLTDGNSFDASDRAALIFAEGPAESGLAPASLTDAPAPQISAPPNLDPEGFRLRSSSAALTHDGILNQLEYRDGSGEEIRVLIHSRNTGVSWPPERATLDGDPVVYWRQGPLTIGVTGNASQDQLDRIAQSIHRQIEAVPEETLIAETPLPADDSLNDPLFVPASQN